MCQCTTPGSSVCSTGARCCAARSKVLLVEPYAAAPAAWFNSQGCHQAVAVDMHVAGVHPALTSCTSCAVRSLRRASQSMPPLGVVGVPVRTGLLLVLAALAAGGLAVAVVSFAVPGLLTVAGAFGAAAVLEVLSTAGAAAVLLVVATAGAAAVLAVVATAGAAAALLVASAPMLAPMASVWMSDNAFPLLLPSTSAAGG